MSVDLLADCFGLALRLPIKHPRIPLKYPETGGMKLKMPVVRSLTCPHSFQRGGCSSLIRSYNKVH